MWAGTESCHIWTLADLGLPDVRPNICPNCRTLSQHYHLKNEENCSTFIKSLKHYCSDAEKGRLNAPIRTVSHKRMLIIVTDQSWPRISDTVKEPEKHHFVEWIFSWMHALYESICVSVSFISFCLRWRPGVKSAARAGYHLRCRSWRLPFTVTRAFMSKWPRRTLR